MPKILFATHNPSKIRRYQKNLILDKNWQFTTAKEEGLIPPRVLENGKNELENAKLKATAYYKISGLPSVALDTGIYFPDLKPEDQPKKDVQRVAGVDDTTEPEERFLKMTSYYQNLVSTFSNNGELKAYFLDVFCLFDGKNYFEAEAQRPIILTTKIHGIDSNFPISSLYKIPQTGKYYHDHSSQEIEQEYFFASIQALQKLISNYVTKHPSTNYHPKLN